jgi:hypothetical protein
MLPAVSAAGSIAAKIDHRRDAPGRTSCALVQHPLRTRALGNEGRPIQHHQVGGNARFVLEPPTDPDNEKEYKVTFQTIFDRKVKATLLACVVLCSVSISPSPAQSAPQNSDKTVKAGISSHYRPNQPSKKAGEYFDLIWGVQGLSVRTVESGALIRFSYRVLDPNKAAILNDKKFDPFLDAPDRGVRLSIPSLEKVGQLRQGSTQEAGKSYWMAFSNPRRTVKRGDRVNVVIGEFHADGLMVE